MEKLLGAVCVCTACGMVGVLLKSALVRRRQELQSLLLMLQHMSAEISYGLNPLPIVLAQAAQAGSGSIADFMQTVAARLTTARGEGITEIWQATLIERRAELPFTDDDIELLREFAVGLGSSGAAEQLKRLELFAVGLERRLQEAEENALRFGRVYTALGWSSGLVLVLFLL